MSSYEEWLEWRRRYYLNDESSDYNDSLSDWENEGGSNLKDVGEHKNLGVGVVGNLKKKQGKVVDQMVEDFLVVQKITKEKLKEGTVNNGTRTAKAEYLRHHTKTVGVINEKGEYEIKPTKRCREGDVVWVMENDGTFTKTKIH